MGVQKGWTTQGKKKKRKDGSESRKKRRKRKKKHKRNKNMEISKDLKTKGSIVEGSEDTRGQEPSFLDKIKEFITKTKAEEDSQGGKNESRMEGFPVSDIEETEETEPWLNLTQYSGYDQEALQGVLGKVLEAEEKARDPDVSEEPLENRELPDDEIIKEEVTDPQTAENVKEEENGNKKKEQRGWKKKEKNKKGGKSVKKQQTTKTKCVKQRQVMPIIAITIRGLF